MFLHFETHCDSCGEDEEYIASGGVAPCARCGKAVTILSEKEYVHVASDMELVVPNQED